MTIPKLKASTATALLGLTAMSLVPGLAILSPDGRLFFLALAGFVSAVVAFLAPSGKKRLVAAVALVIAVVMGLHAWHEHKAHADARKNQISLTASR